MTLPEVLAPVWVTLEYAIKIVALGTVPENRRPSSSTAWLLLIFLLPVVGLPLYIFLGSPWIHGRRREQQVTATESTLQITAALPDAPAGARPDSHLASVLRMNRRLTGLPCVTGEAVALHADAADTYAAMARVVDAAENHVHVEFYIQSWDEVTDVFYRALERAAARGVTVRLLVDHLGSRKYPGWRTLGERWQAAGIKWRLMMPLLPHKRRFRRPDLRNHRKLLIVDGRAAFIGSHNIIDPSYRLRSNVRAGRVWHDLSVEVTGDVVLEAQAVFAMDWYFEAGELIDLLELVPGPDGQALAGDGVMAERVVVGTPAPQPRRPDAVVLPGFRLLHPGTELHAPDLRRPAPGPGLHAPLLRRAAAGPRLLTDRVPGRRLLQGAVRPLLLELHHPDLRQDHLRRPHRGEHPRLAGLHAHGLLLRQHHGVPHHPVRLDPRRRQRRPRPSGPGVLGRANPIL